MAYDTLLLSLRALYMDSIVAASDALLSALALCFSLQWGGTLDRNMYSGLSTLALRCVGRVRALPSLLGMRSPPLALAAPLC